MYVTPDVDLPIAPNGEQKAPGLTSNELSLTTCVGVGMISFVGETVEVGDGVLVTLSPQESIKVFNFVASLASTVKEYLVFIAIQF